MGILQDFSFMNWSEKNRRLLRIFITTYIIQLYNFFYASYVLLARVATFSHKKMLFLAFEAWTYGNKSLFLLIPAYQTFCVQLLFQPATLFEKRVMCESSTKANNLHFSLFSLLIINNNNF